jgi:SAM-dependent methyltransferase
MKNKIDNQTQLAKTVVTQWGSEAIPFKEYDSDKISSFLKEVNDVLAFYTKEVGAEYFLTYGSLLGAVREKYVIEYDFDFDVCILFTENIKSKRKLIQEFLYLIEKLKSSDLTSIVEIVPASACQYAVRFSHSGVSFNVDLFLGWFENDIFYQTFSIDERFLIGRDDVLPFTIVCLNEIEFYAPINVNKILSAIYGPNWSEPDSNFSYKSYFEELNELPPPESTVFGRISQNKKYWDDYYRQTSSSKMQPSPTQFAVFVERFLSSGSSILEVGSGNGRDLNYFISRGYFVHGTDFSEHPLKDIKNIKFSQLDYANSLAVSEFSNVTKESFDCFYARFLFHAVSEVPQSNLINMARKILKKNGLFCAEFRVAGESMYDKKRNWCEVELTGDHYRRPINSDEFIMELSENGFCIEYSAIGSGFAYHAVGDDPVVMRIIARLL